MTPEFFEALEKDNGFCAALGRVVLFAGALEMALRKYLEYSGHSIEVKRATLEKLLSTLKKQGLVSRNMEMVLTDLKDQRNYLSHNIYNLLSGEIEETLLAGKNIADLDILYYTDKATETADNLKAIAAIVQQRLKDITSKGNGRGLPLL